MVAAYMVFDTVTMLNSSVYYMYMYSMQSLVSHGARYVYMYM